MKYFFTQVQTPLPPLPLPPAPHGVGNGLIKRENQWLDVAITKSTSFVVDHYLVPEGGQGSDSNLAVITLPEDVSFVNE